MKKIVLRDKYGVGFGSFQYDPSHPSTYIARGKLAQDALDFGILAQIDLQPDGTATSPADAQILEKAEQIVYSFFDVLLGYTGAGRGIFKTIRPFASVGEGLFFCQTVMRQVTETVTHMPL